MDQSNIVRKENAYRQYLVTAIANLPSFTFGVMIGWLSPSIALLQSPEGPADPPLDDNAIALMAGLPCFIASFGSFFFGWLSNKIGRKYTIIGISIPSLICILLKLLSTKSYILILARCFCGFSGGGVFVVIPTYTKEISVDSLRGMLCSAVVLSINMGMVLAYALGSYLDYYLVLKIYLAIPILHMLAFLRGPESPAYLVNRERYKEADKTISWLRGNPDSKEIVMAEIAKLKDEQDEFVREGKVSLWSVGRERATIVPFAMCLFLFTLQNLGGCFCITNYMSLICLESGAAMSTGLQSIVIGVVNVLGSLFGGAVVEHAGRRILFGGSCLLAFISMGILGICLLTNQDPKWYPGWLPLLVASLAIFSNGAGINPLAYIFMAEVFSYNIKTTIAGIMMTYAGLTSGLALYTFPLVSKAIGMGTSFLCFAVLQMIGFLFAATVMIETKGKSLAELQNEFRGSTKIQLDVEDRSAEVMIDRTNHDG